MKKFRVVGQNGFTNPSNTSKSVFPGDVFEADEAVGLSLVRRGVAVEVEGDEASHPPVGEPAPVVDEVDDEKGDEKGDEKPKGKGKK